MTPPRQWTAEDFALRDRIDKFVTENPDKAAQMVSDFMRVTASPDTVLFVAAIAERYGFNAGS